MANQWQNPVIIADKMLEFFDGLSEVATKINRDYESSFEMTKESVGQTIYVTKPPRYTSQDGPVITTVQDINIGKIPVIVDTWKTVPIKLTGMDLTFNAKEFDAWAEKYLKPMVSPLANAVDVAVFGLWQKIWNSVGTCGTGFGATAGTAWDLIAAAREKLTLVGNTPQEDRIIYLSPTAARKYGASAALGYNPQSAIGNFMQSGNPYRTAGFEMYEANNIGVMTSGTLIGSSAAITTASGALQSGNAITIANGSTLTLKKGQSIKFCGASGTEAAPGTGATYSCNPTSKASTGLLAEFVVTQDFTANTTGTIYIDPPIIPTGAFQNVVAAPCLSSVIFPSGTAVASTAYPQNLAFWKKALGLVTVPIRPPKGLNGVTRTYNGMSITLTTGSDIYNYEQIWRADIAFGVVAYYPENACKIIAN